MENNLQEEAKVFTSFPGLKDHVQKLKAESASPVEQASSVDAQEPVSSAPEEISQPEAAIETPKEQPEVTPEPEKVIEKPWDADDSEPVAETITPISYEKLGSALKLEGVKSESDIVAKFNEIQTKLQTLETTKAATLEGVPDDLKEVLDLAKNGGDWKSYMGASSVNWNDYKPAEVFEHEFSKLPQFTNPDGSFNETAYNDAVDAISEGQKLYEGNRIIQQKINEQQQFKQRQIQVAQQRKEEKDRELVKATMNLSEMLPFNKFGIKFDAKHSDYLFKGISTGQLLNKHFLNESGDYDMSKITKTIALAEYGEKMVKFQAEKSKTAAKKEILQQTQNIQLEPPTRSVVPDEGSEKFMSAPEKMKKYLEAQRRPNNL